jgi:hypothetical protein
VDIELVRVGKEAIAMQFEVLSQNLLGGGDEKV